MADPRDDKVSAAFRGLPPIEPPTALDDAIRAAARRAVAAKPVSTTRRWAIPASIAAVLALSIGIALQVEREKPLVVDGTPVPSGSAEYPVTQAPVESPTRVEAPKAEPLATAEPLAKAEVPKAEPASKDAPPASRTPDPGMLRDETRAAPPAPAPAAPVANEAVSPFAPAPVPGTARAPVPSTAAVPAQAAAPAPALAPLIAAPPAAAPPAPRPAATPPATADSARASSSEMAPAAQSAAPMRAKREAAGASVAKEATMPSPEKALERIAELRAAGRHAEADEALAKFRRDHPDFRIAPELWEKVRAR